MAGENKVGRPSKYSKELAEKICDLLSEGTPMTVICKMDDMPAFKTVRMWEDNNEEFCKLSTRARLYGTDYLADDCLKIADDSRLDPADKRVRIDTRLRLIGKWNAQKYGDKSSVDHTIKIDHEKATDDELLAIATGSGSGIIKTQED